jgi:signal transduction histidine kinase
MDEEILGRLFDPTSRVTTAGTDGEKGSGFGLVLCAEFASRLGGTLSAKSQKGAGSVFTLSLPPEPSGA